MSWIRPRQLAQAVLFQHGRRLDQQRQLVPPRQPVRARWPALFLASSLVSRMVAEGLGEGRSGWASMTNPMGWIALFHRRVLSGGLAAGGALKVAGAWGGP